MHLKHIASPLGMVVFFPMTAHADVFDWSLSTDARSGLLGEIKGGRVTYRSGVIDQGEHVEIAVELTWTAKKGTRSVSQIVIHTMADSPATVLMDGSVVVVSFEVLPWGEESPTIAKRCFGWEASGTRFVEMPCP